MTIDIKKTGLTSMIFLIMISISFIVIQPIYESTVNRLILLRTSMIETLEQKTGLSITYESMSPSILTGLRISKIQLIDAENSSVLAKISSVRFSYNILNLIRRSENSLNSLIVTGISAEFDELSQKHIADKIEKLLSSLNNDGGFNGLPFSIRISTAALAYKNENIRVKLQMRDTVLKNSISGKRIQFTSTNTLSCTFLDDALSGFGPVSSNFTLQGSINHALTES
ncbi:MAG: hypothetical protein KA785_08530, partial [Spirochaetaceae bacterium]|nr:hypothetical protein [Spirochaetaceae bacterium]